jgi:O-antigen ligase
MKEADSFLPFPFAGPLPAENKNSSTRATFAGNLRSEAGFLTVLILVAVTATPFGMESLRWEVGLSCSIFLLSACRVSRTIALGQSSWREYWMILVPVGLVALLAFLQTISLTSASTELQDAPTNTWWAISADPAGTRQFAFRLLMLLFLGFLLFEYVSERRRLVRISNFIIGLGVISALLGMIQMVISSGPAWLFPYLGVERAFGQFANRNHFALFMEMTLGLSLGFLTKRDADAKSRMPYLISTFVISLAIILTSSRGGVTSMLGMFLLTGIWLAARFGRGGGDSTQTAPDTRFNATIVGKGLIRIGILIASLLLCSLAVVWIGGDRLADRFEESGSQVSEQDGATNPKEARIRMWQATVAMVKANPLMGTGMGAYPTAITKYHRGSGDFVPFEAHNEYLEIQASGGVLASALVLWLFAGVVLYSSRSLRVRSLNRRAIATGALLGLFGVALHSLVDSGLHININIMTMTILIVLAAASVKGMTALRPV